MAFAGAKVAAAHLFHKRDFPGKRAPRREREFIQVSPPGQGPVPLHHSSLQISPEEAFLLGAHWPLLSREEGLGQEAARTGSRAEAGRRSGRSWTGGWAPLTPSPTSLQESNAAFPKIFTVSLN